MAGMRSVTVFPHAQGVSVSPVQIDYNQQLQDLIDSSNQVKTAVDNIEASSPTDLTPLLTKLDSQIALIDAFKQQSDANEISTKVAVDTVRTAVDQLKQTVQGENSLLMAAIAAASQDEQDNLNATLNATVGALQSALVSEFNESQALLAEQSGKLTSILNNLTGAPEAEIDVSLNLDTSAGAKEVVIPAGWSQGDIGPNFLDAAGVESQDGAEIDVEIAGRTESVLKNGEWHRQPRVGFMGKPVPTRAARIIVKQAESTTHIVFSYPESQAPASLVAAAIVSGGINPDLNLAVLVGNLYNSGDGAPYTDDLLGLYTAIQSGSTFVDVTTGPEGVLVDSDADGTGDRQLTQAEYDGLAAASQADIDALILG